MFRSAPIVRTLALAIAFILIASCSSGTSTPQLTGTYQLVAADGAFIPVRYEPLYNVLPYTWITGGSVDVRADSMHLILHLKDKDAAGTIVGTPPDIDQWINYTRTGDSLVVVPASTTDGGQYVTPDVRLHVSFPAHPSTGLALILHTFFFQQ